MTTSITVLVAARSHPASGRATRSRADATAVTLALGLAAPLRLLTAGDMSDSVARDYLALGAPLLEILDSPPDADPLDSLLPALQDVPWVLTGTRSAAEFGSGLLPYALAARLGRPLVSDVLAVQIDGSVWTVTQALPKGARRQLRLRAPAVLAVSAAAPVTLRHALADAMAGRIVHSAAQTTSPAPAPGQQVPSSKRRAVLQARVQQSGHARMLGAIDSPSTGGAVLATGSPADKAQAVLAYLRAHSLVTF